MSQRRLLIATAAASIALSIAAAPALGAFPFSRDGADTSDYDDLYLGPGDTPSDLGGKLEWMYAATPEPGNLPVNLDPTELNGVRGAHVVDDDAAVKTAWQRTTGRPDVTIAVLDSGIKWNDAGAMNNLRFKTRINEGEAREPRNDALAQANEPGQDCASALTPYVGNGYDLNEDGVFNLLDYACDDRVEVDPLDGVGPPGLLDPQDVLIAFSDGVDDDNGGAGNGYIDDMVGWDFLDDDNDPYDDVQYGHGTGEAQDSGAEADNGGELGTCPNCLLMHMRVGDSFVADVNRFATAVTYGVDNGALVIQEALGTLNNSNLARESVRYANDHGVAVIASAADEAAQHNNWPSSLPGVILVNSVTQYDETFTPVPRSYLQFTGCTNFNSKVTVAIPSVSCSSDATGRGSGMAGLIYSAALNAIERGKLDPHPSCVRAIDGPDPGSEPDPCPLSSNEVKQLMASGTIGGARIADDVDFASKPEPSCNPAPLPGCTDPNLNTSPLPQHSAVVSPVPTERYPARFGHDQFYGYGRVNMNSTLAALLPAPALDSSALSLIPPEVEITSPEWYDQLDPEAAGFQIRGGVWARGDDYSCIVQIAPGHYPNNRDASQAPPGDFETISSTVCNGSTRNDPIDGLIAEVDAAALRALFPLDANAFDGAEPGAGAGQLSNGRPNAAPHGFTIRIIATRNQAGQSLSGEDRRNAYLHRDAGMLEGFPRKFDSDISSSPSFVDLDGDNRNELVFGSSDGIVHALRRDPASGVVSELSGWPVRTDRPGIVANHLASPAYSGDDVSGEVGGPILGSTAIGDMDRDGLQEVYAADLEGQIYGWNHRGERIFDAESDPAYSGAPLTPFVNEREGSRNRTQRGFIGSPVLADLDGDDGGKLELIIAGMDRHVYAFEDDGSPLDGFPVLVVDETKVESVDPASHAVRFRADAGQALDQGGIVDTPSVADISGDERPEIIVGTNEEYLVNDGSEGPHNVAPSSAPALGALAQTGVLEFANGRVYAISPDGDPDGPASGSSPWVSGWPVPIGLLFAELLPVVGEGINGSPVIADLDCPIGGPGPKVGLIPAAGVGYVLNADGSSCFGEESGLDRVLGSEVATPGATEEVAIPAVGLPAFGDLGGTQPTFVAPVAGLFRALDLAVNEYQLTGQDYIGAWDTNSPTARFRPGWPAQVNDLSFLTGPAVADIDGLPGEEVLAGTASMDLAAFNALGAPIAGWPKLSTDWTVATPLIGSFGSRDTDADVGKVVVGATRSGYVNAYGVDAPACSPSSSPRFHHDIANSGDYERDAVAPGAVTQFAVAGEKISFTAPGDDLLCGTADAYELVTAGGPIDEASFAAATPLSGAPQPVAAGGEQSFPFPAAALRWIAIRALDEQGNPGRVATLRVRADDSDPGPNPDPDPSPNPDPSPDPSPNPDPGLDPSGCDSVVRGSPSADRLEGTTASERITGGPGDDVIRGRGGDDCLKGNRGADRIAGGRGADRIDGGPGRDVLRGGAGADRIDSRGGGHDKARCGGGRDRIVADRGDRIAKDCERVRIRRVRGRA